MFISTLNKHDLKNIRTLFSLLFYYFFFKEDLIIVKILYSLLYSESEMHISTFEEVFFQKRT